MYEQAFHLNRHPFSATPSVDQYFPAQSIHHAGAQARMCVERGSGPVIITGGPGTGKTLLLALLAEQASSQFQIVNLSCTRLEQRIDLLQSILFELRQPYRDMTEGELRLSLIDYLKSDQSDGQPLLLLVDEAHSLSPDLLDELRLITNLVRNGRPHVSLVMAGAPSLEDHLIETRSESFNQRIAARCYLTNLSQAETIEYVLTHIERAGGNAEELFTDEALKLVHQASGGCPRVINQICDYSLVIAASMDRQRITAEIVKQAWQDVQSIPGDLPTHTAATSDQKVANSSDASNAAIDSGMIEAGDDVVIEFGQLSESETEPDDCLSATSGSETGHSPVTATPTALSYVEFDPETGSVIDEVSNANTSGIGGEFPPVDGQHQQDSLQPDPSEPTAPTSASQPESRDPFDEPFEQVERINAQFFPAVSEENLKAAMLSSQQVAVLDTIASINVDPASLEISICTDPLELDGSLPSEPTQIVRPFVPDENEAESANSIDAASLQLTSDELSQLDRLEQDVMQMQTQFDLSGLVFKTVAEPPYESAAASETGYPATTAVDAIAAEPANESREIEDDRDMMVIGESQRTASESRADDSHANANSGISTGPARRMDYRELFLQLRKAE